VQALAKLRQAGFVPGISPAGGLFITPASRLTAAQRDYIRAHKVLLIEALRAEQIAPEPSPVEAVTKPATPCCASCVHSITPADTDPIYGWRLCAAGGFGGFARAVQQCGKWEARQGKPNV
jgi:hypothetical protein